jgi:polar amino acid transport system permease protein
MAVSTDAERKRPGIIPWSGDLSRFPWWILVVMLVGVGAVYLVLTNRFWEDAFEFTKLGIRLTLTISLTSFSIALVFGLITGLGQLSNNIVARNLSQLYVQVIRGIPIIVQLYVMAFVIMPLIVDALNGLGGTFQTIAPLAGQGNSGAGNSIWCLRGGGLQSRH